MFGFDLQNDKLNTRKLPPGWYETIPAILKAMALTSHEGKINFKFILHTKRVKIKTTDGDKVILEKGKDGDVINVLYDRPHYVPIIRQSFQSNKIEIRVNSGDLVPFEKKEKSLSFYLFE
ncbi:uncharacterized protein CEXT_645601 [Caerostris extrusa]|uniref:Uncharacterized protein n=1 Tax=Caerostris extrusa TaxID=172846 RepID=A0AAV4MWL3_CAEEX|nr:uncharacterized protein CEXT_645601 [Caerostris extrusa]